jgi:hypothetical protein
MLHETIFNDDSQCKWIYMEFDWFDGPLRCERRWKLFHVTTPWMALFAWCTRKNAQVVTSLETSCNKAVVKLISGFVRRACTQLLWQVWNNLLSPRYKVDDGNRLAIQVVPTRLIQAVWACCHQLVNNLQTVSDLLEQLVSASLLDYKMITTFSRLVTSWEQAVRIQLVEKLWDFYV